MGKHCFRFTQMQGALLGARGAVRVGPAAKGVALTGLGEAGTGGVPLAEAAARLLGRVALVGGGAGQRREGTGGALPEFPLLSAITPFLPEL